MFAGLCSGLTMEVWDAASVSPVTVVFESPLVPYSSRSERSYSDVDRSQQPLFSIERN